MGKIKKRAGFTLIEVIVALGIFLIVVLALLSGYAFYYKSVRDLRYQTVGENLAQLQLEDLRNIGIAPLGSILRDGARFPMSYDCPNYPPAEIIENPDGTFNYYFYKREKLAPITYDNLPNWNDLDDPRNLEDSGIYPLEVEVYNIISKTWEPKTFGNWDKFKPVFESVQSELASITYEEINEIKYPVYSSGKRDSDFIVEGLTSVPSDPVLPGSIIVAPSANQIGKYDLIIEKWTFPLYKKEIKIEDLNPEIPKEQLTKKLYMVSVTVFWTVNGIEKSVTVNQEVGFEGQEP
jgi:prepilin-type N-terminal cleavage/methylation domain-containing protein